MHGHANTSTATATFWEQAYINNFATLCARASRQLTKGNIDDAEDTVSEAFARAMRYAVQPEVIANPVSYMWTIVKRVWTTKKTGADETEVGSLEALSVDAIESQRAVRVEPEVFRVLEEEETRRQLKLKLGPLTLEEQQLIDFRLKGYSWSEVAEELGEDVKKIQFRWYRFTARQRYRNNKLRARTQAAMSS
jgi:DNA-directed RNA polymerase specialized sigma24 family protein